MRVWNRSKHGTRSAHMETELMWKMAWKSNGGKMAMPLNGTGAAWVSIGMENLQTCFPQSYQKLQHAYIYICFFFQPLPTSAPWLLWTSVWDASHYLSKILWIHMHMCTRGYIHMHMCVLMCFSTQVHPQTYSHTAQYILTASLQSRRNKRGCGWETEMGGQSPTPCLCGTSVLFH